MFVTRYHSTIAETCSYMRNQIGQWLLENFIGIYLFPMYLKYKSLTVLTCNHTAASFAFALFDAILLAGKIFWVIWMTIVSRIQALHLLPIFHFQVQLQQILYSVQFDTITLACLSCLLLSLTGGGAILKYNCLILPKSVPEVCWLREKLA